MEDLEKRINSFLEKDKELLTGGYILTNSKGDLLTIVDNTDDCKKPYCGMLEYSYDAANDSCEVIYIGNNYKVNSEFKKYKDNKGRKKGLLTLFNTFQSITEMVGATKMAINTWILSARPKLLTDPNSFFYGWQPLDKTDHKEAVESNKGIKKLRNQKSIGTLAYYYKTLKVDETKKKFDIPKQEENTSDSLRESTSATTEEITFLSTESEPISED